MDVEAKLREIAASDPDPGRRKEAERRLAARVPAAPSGPGFGSENYLMSGGKGGIARDAMKRKLAETNARTEKLRAEESAGDSAGLDVVKFGLSKLGFGGAGDAVDRSAAVASGASGASGMGLMGLMALTSDSEPDERPGKTESSESEPPLPATDSLPALDALIARHADIARQVRGVTVKNQSVSDKLVMASSAARVKESNRAEKLRNKMPPKRDDYLRSYDPITGDENAQ